MSFGDVQRNWRNELIQTLQIGHTTGKLPSLNETNRYSVYLYKDKCTFAAVSSTHWSMVMGLTNNPNGCFELELLLNAAYTEILIRAKVYDRKPFGELQCIVNDASIEELVDIAIDRMNKHGKYCAFFNNHKNFVARCVEQYGKKAKEKEAMRKRKEEETRAWNNSWTGMAWNGLSNTAHLISDKACEYGKYGAEKLMDKELHGKALDAAKAGGSVLLGAASEVIKQGTDYAIIKACELDEKSNHNDDNNNMSIMKYMPKIKSDENLFYLTEKWGKGEIDNIGYAKGVIKSTVSVASSIGSGIMGLSLASTLAHMGHIGGIGVTIVAIGLTWIINKILSGTCKWIVDKIFAGLDDKKEKLVQKEALDMFDYKSIENIDEKELRKRYKKLALNGYHPDRGGSNEQFAALSGQYDFLMRYINANKKLYHGDTIFMDILKKKDVKHLSI